MSASAAMNASAGKLRALGYYGGKSPHGGRSLGRWISDCIGPTPRGWAYVEPFAGMLGVLLSRPPATLETANDASGWIVAWWRAVRDAPVAFGALVDSTPYARSEYADAAERYRRGLSGDGLRDALTAHILIEQSRTHSTKPTGWSRRLTPHKQGSPGAGRNPLKSANIAALAERLHAVQLEHGCALELLEAVADVRRAVIYVDPPYSEANTRPYDSAAIDRERMAELLAKQAGRVAVSGYGSEWDCLGWRRESAATYTRTSGQTSERLERLWLNFPAPPPAGFFA